MFEHLLQPGQIGKMAVKNRMKYAATINYFCNPETGEVTDREVAYLEERARGGAGMVTTQGGYPHLLGKAYASQMSLDHDRLLPGLRRLAQAIQVNGARAVAQILHGGRYAHPTRWGIPDKPAGPTAMAPKLSRYEVCRELTREEIERIVEIHGQAAKRVKEAGFDAVEVCGIAGYLISSFLCRWTNKRSDEYGGSLENRSRLYLQIIRQVKKEAGVDYPLVIRLNATDLMDEGNTEEEYIEIARMCEEAGVDAISLTVGWHESNQPVLTPEVRPGQFLYLAENWKKAGIKVPLIMAYRLYKPDLAEKAIAEGIIDYWEMCRPMIADPYIPVKVAGGRPEDIAICPACNWCGTRNMNEAPMACTMNARAGREGEDSLQVRPAGRKKKIIVVGGGPAGMEAARVAAMRGHDVTLFEKNDRLGGQLNLAAKTPTSECWAEIVDYLRTQLIKTGVKVVLQREATPGSIGRERPDAVILATGAKPIMRQIPGIDRGNVLSVFDVLERGTAPGNRIVVLGGRAIGVQTAEMLASQGKGVTLVEESERWGRDINPHFPYQSEQ